MLATGQNPERSHWVKVNVTQNGYFGLMVRFPRFRARRIQNVEGFCGQLYEGMMSGARLMYGETDLRFYMYDVIHESALASHLAFIARDCDLAKPICERVCELGYWDSTLLAFVLQPPKGQKPH